MFVVPLFDSILIPTAHLSKCTLNVKFERKRPTSSLHTTKFIFRLKKIWNVAISSGSFIPACVRQVCGFRLGKFLAKKEHSNKHWIRKNRMCKYKNRFKNNYRHVGLGKSNALYCINMCTIIVGTDTKTQLVNTFRGVPGIICHSMVIYKKERFT